MIKPWPIVKTREGPDMGLFSVRVNRCRSPRTGEEHDFYVIDLKSVPEMIRCGDIDHGQAVMGLSMYLLLNGQGFPAL